MSIDRWVTEVASPSAPGSRRTAPAAASAASAASAPRKEARGIGFGYAGEARVDGANTTCEGNELNMIEYKDADFSSLLVAMPFATSSDARVTSSLSSYYRT